MKSFMRLALLKFPRELGPEGDRQLVEMLKSLRTSVEGLSDIAYGRDTSERSAGYTHALSLRFVSEAHHEAYLPHSQHVALGAFLKARNSDVLLFTFVDEL
jgi:hypothetical protein